MTTPATYTWALQAASASSSSESEPVAGRRGIVLPFQRDQKQDFANGGVVDVVMSNLVQVCGTACMTDTSAGECEWDPELGSPIVLARHVNSKAARRAALRAYLILAFREFEPRARMRAVVVQQVDRSLHVDIYFDIVDAPSGAVVVPDVRGNIFIPEAA